MNPRLLLQRACQFVITLGLLGSPVVSAATPGELDLSFSPAPELANTIWSFSIIDRHLYPNGGTDPAHYRRLREDGSVDDAWRITAPIQGPILSVSSAPWGGWTIQALSRAYQMQRDGSFELISRSGFSPHGTAPIYPTDDGAWVSMAVDGMIRIQPNGRVDPNARRDSRLRSIAFVKTGGGSVSVGNNNTWDALVRDTQGRLILGGTFQSVAGEPRIGLARLLPDGQLDRTWDPGPALGLAKTPWADPEVLAKLDPLIQVPTEFITARPTALALGTNDSVLISIEEATPNGGPDRRLAIVDAQGKVVSSFPDTSLRNPHLMRMQPDGRIFLGGGLMTEWNGTPVGNLIRVEADGTLDPSFQASLAPNSSMVYDMALDDAGRLWISGGFDSVNGVARPGLARLHAYQPSPVPVRLNPTYRRERIGTNEVLYLTAQVTGNPTPALQWYRDDVPIPGESNRGLRLVITNEAQLGTFRLVAVTPGETHSLDFGRVTLGDRSPNPGSITELWAGPLGNVVGVTHLVPLQDGKVLFAAGQFANDGPRPMVGRLRADGTPDPEFGTAGLVMGNGMVRDLRPLPDGGLLVAGDFTELGGAPASGLAELTADGERVDRPFPALDIPSLHAALKLPDGRYLLAGRFNQVGGQPRFRVARLKADLSLDPSFSVALEPFQLVDVLELDLQGRVLAGGAGFLAQGVQTNPPPFGLVRLLDSGAADPSFRRVTTGVNLLFVEPGGTLLAGLPAARYSDAGERIATFELPPGVTIRSIGFRPALARLADRGAILMSAETGPSVDLVVKWRGDGRYDEAFNPPIPLVPNSLNHQVTAVAQRSDGSILFATHEFRLGVMSASIRRILPDSDRRLSGMRLEGGHFRAALMTQPGRRYQIHTLPGLGAGESAVASEIVGDGYRADIAVPAGGREGYLELRTE